MSVDSPTPDPSHQSSRSGPAPHAAARRRPLAVAAAAAAVLVLLAAGVVGGILLPGRDGNDSATRWQPGSDASPTHSPSPSPSPTPSTPSVTLSAVGDIVLGDAERLPPDDGDGFFADVEDALAADLAMGNLEQPLTDDTGYEKCDEDSDACHAFRAPPRYASHLHDGGFDLMNLANNHGNDFGPDGRVNTQAALAEHDLEYTGERDQITVVDVAPAGEDGAVTVAVVGFSPYAWTNDLNDLTQAAAVVSTAAAQADLVVVQVHMGAEGSDATRVSPGTETYFGEDRGDPMAFSRAVIDAGADLVVGHGPHVLRALEFYQGRLIAYSLGNFAGGGGTLNAAGNLGLGGVLRVTLHADGGFAGGEFISTHMYDNGVPQLDPEERGLELLRDLTAADFPDTGAPLGPSGEIAPPT